MQTPEQQIQSLKRENRRLQMGVAMLSLCVVMLIVTQVRGQSIHHMEGYYLDNDFLTVTVEGNNVLNSFGMPFRQTVSIEHCALSSSTTPTTVFSCESKFNGPGIRSPFLTKLEGVQGYAVANSESASARIIRDPSGAWSVDRGQPLPQVR